MDEKPLWSFVYEADGVVSSFEIIADNKAEAESLLASSRCEGSITASDSVIEGVN